MQDQFLISDVVKADVELADLEEEDEITVSKIQAIRSKSSSTRSRGRQAVQTELKADGVQRYLQEKAEWVAREQAGSPAPTQLFFGHELDRDWPHRYPHQFTSTAITSPGKLKRLARPRLLLVKPLPQRKVVLFETYLLTSQ